MLRPVSSRWRPLPWLTSLPAQMWYSGTGRLVRMSPERSYEMAKQGQGIDGSNHSSLHFKLFAAPIASCIQDKMWSKPSKSTHLYITAGNLVTCVTHIAVHLATLFLRTEIIPIVFSFRSIVHMCVNVRCDEKVSDPKRINSSPWPKSFEEHNTDASPTVVTSC
jgi:hypothetical protein